MLTLTNLSHCFECEQQLKGTGKNCLHCGTDHPAGVECFLCGEKLPQSQATFVRQHPTSGYCHEYCLAESQRSVDVVNRSVQSHLPEPNLPEPNFPQPNSPQPNLPQPIIQYQGRLPRSSQNSVLLFNSTSTLRPPAQDDFDLQVRQSQWPYRDKPLRRADELTDSTDILQVFAKPLHTRRRDATRILRPNHYRAMLDRLRHDLKRYFSFNQRKRSRSRNQTQAASAFGSYAAPTQAICCSFAFAFTALACISFILGSVWGGVFFAGFAVYYLLALVKN